MDGELTVNYYLASLDERQDRRLLLEALKDYISSNFDGRTSNEVLPLILNHLSDKDYVDYPYVIKLIMTLNLAAEFGFCSLVSFQALLNIPNLDPFEERKLKALRIYMIYWIRTQNMFKDQLFNLFDKLSSRVHIDIDKKIVTDLLCQVYPDSIELIRTNISEFLDEFLYNTEEEFVELKRLFLLKAIQYIYNELGCLDNIIFSKIVEYLNNQFITTEDNMWNCCLYVFGLSRKLSISSVREIITFGCMKPDRVNNKLQITTGFQIDRLREGLPLYINSLDINELQIGDYEQRIGKMTLGEFLLEF